MYRLSGTTVFILTTLLSLPLSAVSGAGTSYQDAVASTLRLDSLPADSPSKVVVFPNRTIGSPAPVFNHRRKAWIDSLGLTEDTQIIRTQLEETKRDDYWLERVSQNLAAQYGAKEIARLKSLGIDIIAAYTHPERVNSQSAERLIAGSDIVFIGEIIKVNTNAYDVDDFASTVTVRVREMLKGDTSLRIVNIRRYGGQLPDSMGRYSTSDFDVTRKTSQLFQVSKALYPLRVIDREKTPISASPPFYIVQANPREIQSDGSLGLPDGCLFGEVPSYKIEEIRAAAAQWRMKTKQ